MSMSASKHAYPNITYLRFGSTTHAARLPRWLCLIQAVVGYEWLVSGINKLVNSVFGAQLAAMLRQHMQGNPYGWYVTFLQRYVLPHPVPWAQGVAWGETAIGVILLLGAVRWALEPEAMITTLLAWLACPALLGAAVMSVNYCLMAGYGLPWVNAANAFDEGVRLDAVLPLFCVALLGANLSALLARHGTGARAPEAVTPLREAA